jgi:CubicO group peptidase (beta-lactamase class C family)
MDPKFPQPEFETFVRRTLDLWRVPGASIAIVKDGRVIHCAGYGLRDKPRGLPVTGDTLFPIASCTKAFTALALAMLVEQGKLEWDRPVREVMPDFCLQDEYAAQHITPRDLLCHRSGLPGHDMLWYATGFSRQEIFRRLRYLEPTRDLRAAFQYQNLMYIVAGLLVERASGVSWESFVQERIFTPLGMQRSGFSTVLLRQEPDHSRPYREQDGAAREVPYFEADGERSTTGAAGAITSCASDQAKWLLFQLQGGFVDNTRLISPQALEALRQPQIFYDDAAGRQRHGFEFTSYGLGWFLRMHKGQFLMWHDGDADGFKSFIALAPHRSLGVAVLSNAEFSPAPGALACTIIDRLLGLEQTDWNQAELAALDEMGQAVQQMQTQSARQRKAGPPSHPIEAYLGDYQHPGYGLVSVCRAGPALKVVLNAKLEFSLEHYHYDIFEVIDEHFYRREKVNFHTHLDGMIGSLSVKMDPAARPAVFTRLPGSPNPSESAG